MTAEVEILARDLLKIHKDSENMKNAIKEMSDSQNEFFAAIERFVTQYVVLKNTRRISWILLFQ